MATDPLDKVIEIKSFVNLAQKWVKTQQVFNDPDTDMKLYLEIAGFMVWRYMEYAEKSVADVTDYASRYLEEVVQNYQDTKLKDRNENKNQ